MILPEHIPHFERLRPYYKGTMLLLGDQEFAVPFKFGCETYTLDIQGNPTIKWDLTRPDTLALGTYGSVFNLGTLEHIWDVHTAYCNVIRLIEVGGFYIGHHPVAGYEGHGIHVTDLQAILDFFEINGFKIMSAFTTLQDGTPCAAPGRNCGRSVILWFAAKKETAVDEFKVPVDLCK